jgi:GNAT superfamily N-acetyltransferase
MQRVRKPTRVWYLELPHASDLRPAPVPEGVTVALAAVPLGALNSFFYLEVGRGHHWIDRADWSPATWQRHAERVATWLVSDRGTPAGYAELARHRDGTVNIAFFGLLEPFRGRGIGGHFLTEVVRRAWDDGATRVTLNTCELDGPGALHNYRARGFTVVRETIEQRAREAS